VPLDQQREFYSRYAEAATDELLTLLQTRRAELIELGVQRAFRDVGVHEYGDSTYFHSADRIDDEVAAELADAIFYLTVSLARRGGDLPDIEPEAAPPPLD
jgi:phosphoribosyl-ATP pyrophosphohydrolase